MTAEWILDGDQVYRVPSTVENLAKSIVVITEIYRVRNPIFYNAAYRRRIESKRQRVEEEKEQRRRRKEVVEVRPAVRRRSTRLNQ